MCLIRCLARAVESAASLGLFRVVGGLWLAVWIVGGVGCGPLPCDQDQDCPGAQICHPQGNYCLTEGMECPPGLERSCFPGASGLAGVGSCRSGNQVCNDQGRWGECLGATLPGEEVCDGEDNDCDGTIDEGCEVKLFCNSLKPHNLLTAQAFYIDGEPRSFRVLVSLSASSGAVWGAPPKVSFQPKGWSLKEQAFVEGSEATKLELLIVSDATEPRVPQILLSGDLLFPRDGGKRCEISWGSRELAAGCEAGRVVCGRECAALSSSPKHCGRCDNACDEGEACTNGQCIPTSCPQGKSLCGAVCVDLSVDPSHCGKCDAACSSAMACRDGGCVLKGPPCGDGLLRCDTECVDLQVNKQHCGQCGTACIGQQICTSGRCVACPECPLWARFGGVTLTHVAVDGQRQVYVAGTFSQEVTFGGVTLKPVGKVDLVLAKLSPDGQFLWVKATHAVAGGVIKPNAFVASAKGELYIAGAFSGGADLGGNALTSKGGTDAFVGAVLTSGQWRWAKAWGGAGDDAITALDVGANDELVAAVKTVGDVSLDATAIKHHGNKQKPNYTIAQMSRDGAIRWHFHFRSDSILALGALGFGQAGDVYFAAGFTLLLPFSKNGGWALSHRSSVMGKLSPSGQPLWLIQLGTAGTTTPKRLAISPGDILTLVGEFDAPLPYGAKTAFPRGGKDIFISQWDNTGKMLWLKSAGGPHDDEAYGLAVDSNGRSYVVGDFKLRLSFDDASLLANDQTTRGFVMMLGRDGGGLGMMAIDASQSAGRDVATDASDGLVAVGAFHSTKASLHRLILRSPTSDAKGLVFKIPKPQHLCWGDMQMCSGACVSTESSLRHCGACGNVCASSESCERGRCVPCQSCGAWLSFGGTDPKLDGTAEIFKAARDAQDNVYIVGNFTKTINFGGITITDKAKGGAFLAKINNAGKWLWAKALTSSEKDSATAIVVDASGDVYWGGRYGAGTSFEGQSLPGSRGQFFCKMDPSGRLIWIKTVQNQSSQSGVPTGFALSKSGHLVVSGAHYNGAVFGSTTLTTKSRASYDSYVAALKPDGTWAWVTPFKADTLAYCRSISVAPSGQIFAIGIFRGKLTFQGTTYDGGLKYDAFVASFDGSGGPLWFRSVQGFTTDDRGQGIVVDGQGVYISGHFTGTVAFGTQMKTSAGREDIFVARLDHAGNWKWVKTFGSADVNINRAIAFNSKGELLVTGEQAGVADFGGMRLSIYGHISLHVVHMDTSGKVLGAFGAGGPGEDRCSAGAIVDSQDRIIMPCYTKSKAFAFGQTLYRRTQFWDPAPFVARLDITRPCPWLDYKVCNNVCTEIKTNNANCGACGNVCSAGKSCVAGVCQ